MGAATGTRMGAPGMSDYVAIGSEFLVNTETAFDQLEPTVTALSDGGFVVTWMAVSQDGSGWGIFAQRYTVAGVATGSEFRVNTTTAGDQSSPTVAALSDGGFIVSWNSWSQDGSLWGVYAQRYEASGAATGSEFLVNTETANHQYFATIAALSDGGFVISWNSVNQDGSGDGVYAQRYNAAGVATGGEFQVNTTTTSEQYAPTIVALNDGGFIVSWTSEFQDGSEFGIYAQRYTAAGAATGGEFQVNTFTAGQQYLPSIAALDDGGFVVSWMSFGQDGSDWGIYAQRYDAAGSAAGGEFRANTVTSGSQANPAISALSDGGFVVSWNSVGQDGSGYGVYAQRYSAAGVPEGGEFQVNTATAGNQSGPTITTLGDGGFVVSWISDGQDGSGYGVYAQMFALANQAPELTGTQAALADGVMNTGYTIQLSDLLAGFTDADGDTMLVANLTADHGSVIDNGNGSYTVTPSAGYTGPVTLSYEVVDGQGGALAAQLGFALTAFTGGPGNDTLTGTAGPDLLTSGGGIDTIQGLAGNDTIVLNGPIGNGSTFAGGADQDTLEVTAAAMTVYPYGAFAQLTGTNVSGFETIRFDSLSGVSVRAMVGMWQIGGVTTLQGDAGNDVLVIIIPTAGTHALQAFTLVDWTDGSDVILFSANGVNASVMLNVASHAGIYNVNGGAFNDTLNGSAGVEVLNGNAGDDSLDGGDGDDTMTGGAGADKFDIDTGNDIITDFTVGEDKIDLSDSSVTSMARLADFLGEEAGSAVIAAEDGSEHIHTVLQGVAASSLTAGDFLFGAGGVPVIQTGTALPDLLFGFELNDTLHGGDGDDRLYSGGGLDRLYGEGDNDTLILDGTISGGSIFDGGAGTDTLVLRNLAVQPSSASSLDPVGKLTTSLNSIGSTFSGIERLDFQSDAGTGLSLNVANGGLGAFVSQIGAGISSTATLTGGAGVDTLVLTSAYTTTTSPGGWIINAPDFTYENWTAVDRAYRAGDRVVVLNSGNGTGVIYGSAHEGVQHLSGGNANVTINGSDDMDYLTAGGVGQLYGNGGDDTLSAGNIVGISTNAQGVTTASPEGTATFLGSLYDGGTGFDFLMLGGSVNFQGTVQNIEGLYLTPAYTNANPPPGGFTTIQNYTAVTMTGAVWNQLPSDLTIDGIGSITVNLAAGDAFDGSGYAFDNGSNVQFTVNGSTGDDAITGTSSSDTLSGADGLDAIAGGLGNDILNGGASDDVLDGGDGNDTLNGGDDSDTLIGGNGQDEVFGGSGDDVFIGNTNGLDYNDGGTGFDTLDYSQAGEAMLFQAHGGDRIAVYVPAAQLLVADNIDLITGTAFNDSMLFSEYDESLELVGGEGSDTIVGTAFNDVLTGGAGNDTLTGGLGDDSVKFSGARSDYAITVNPDLTLTIVDSRAGSPDGADQIAGIESFYFSDGEYSLAALTNDAPVAEDGALTLDEDTPADGQAIATDADPLTYSLVTGPTHGTLLFNPDGSFEYTPAADYFGDDGFTFKANDGTVDSNIATVSLTVSPVNDAPTAYDSAAAGTEDQPIEDQLAGTDPENDTLTYAVASGAVSGSVSVNPDGSFTYTPDPGFSGEDTFTYIVNDGQTDSLPALVTLTIAADNDAPVAEPGATSGAEDSEITGQVTASDAEGEPLTYSAVDAPSHGQIVMASDGSFTYTPEADYFGPDSFTFIANDGSADSAPATFDLTIDPVDNDPATITGQSAGALTESVIPGAPDTQVSGLLSAVDPDGATAFQPASLAGTYGSLELTSDGAWTYTLADSDPLIDALTPADSVIDAFEVATEDGTTQTVSITIEGANDAPVLSGAKVLQAQGSEFLVNSQTVHSQADPTIAAFDDGGFVIVWKDSNLSTIKAQLYGADGLPVAGEFTVNTQYADGKPTVAALAGGGFAVSWQDYDAPRGYDIKVQLFDGAGSKIGSEFFANTITDQYQDLPSIAGLSNGGFVITWRDSSGTLGDNSDWSIKAQVFDPAGAKVGSEFLVNTQIIGPQTSPSVTGLADGGFVVTWQGGGAQLFDETGAKIGGELAIGGGRPTITGLANGGFVVTWQDTNGALGDASGEGIKAQIFDSLGAAVTGPFQVNSQVLGSQVEAVITADASGGFVVSWVETNSALGDGDGTSIKAQAYDAAGAKVGEEILVNSWTASDQVEQAIAGLSDGRIVITWRTSDTAQDGSGSAVKAQVFALVPEALQVVVAEDTQSDSVDIGATDIDSDTITYSVKDGAAPAKGAVSFDQQAGTFIYTPNANEAGTDSFTILISDGSGGTAERSVTITIEPANDAPHIVPQFETAATYGGILGAVYAAGGDFNGDGTFDFAVVDGFAISEARVFTGQGDGTFVQSAPFFNGSGGARSVYARDLNADGKLDLIYGNSNAGAVGVTLGNGDGTFGAFASYSAGIAGFPGSGPHTVTFGDVNGDGHVDMVTGGAASSALLLGNGDGTFAAATQIGGTTGSVSTVALADFDGDGFLDLVLADNGGTSLRVLDGNGDGTFSLAATYGISTTIPIGVGDFNQDGLLDLAIGNNDTVTILSGNGDGTFQQLGVHSTNPGMIDLAVADIDGDGRLDIVTSNYSSSSLSLLLGNGDGSFRDQTVYATAPLPSAAVAGDIDGDGDIDLIVTIPDSSQVTVLRQNLAGSATEDAAAIAGQLVAADPDAGAVLTFALDQAVAGLVLNPDGSWTFDPADPAYQSLAQGQIIRFTAPFTVTDEQGASASSVLIITVTGSNDAAVFTGTVDGEVTEAGGVLNGDPGSPDASGTLLVEDPDAGQAVFAEPASLVGTYGDFTFDAETGAWTYQLDNSRTATQALAEGAAVTDILTVNSLDGTASQDISITVHAANDAAVIGGATSGNVAEASAANGASQVTGTLTISDVDNPDEFAPGPVVGLYGTLTIAAGGGWTYVLDNANPLVDGLSNTEQLVDTVTVTAADGTTQDIVITVAGANDIRTGGNGNDALTGTSGNDTLAGNGGSDTLNGGLGTDTLNGGTGTDTASYAGLASSVAVSLAIAGPQNTGGGDLDTLISIENLTGTEHDDTLAGNGSANVLDGGEGNDVLDGGSGADTLSGGNGSDTASYLSAGSAVTVNLAAQGSAQNTGGGGNDTLNAIENLTGSGFNDTLTGNSVDNVLDGGTGNDTLDGGLGNDTLIGGVGAGDTATYATAGAGVTASLVTQSATGGAGTDTYSGIENLTGSGFTDLLTGDGGANILRGGAGDDILDGGEGNDTLDGGVGTNDRVSYAAAASAVTVNLALTTAQVTGMGTDTLTNIEQAVGSNFADSLTGNGGANTLWGGDAGDVLNGAGGNDTIYGDDGNDTIDGGANNDTLDGGLGIDTLSFASATAFVIVGLDLTVQQNTNGAGIDTVSNFENLTGSSFNDNLTGDAQANVIAGGNGNDTIEGGLGDDTLDGGAGTGDFASYLNASSGVTVNLSLAGPQNTIGAGVDALTGFENINGSGFNDTLTGNAGANSLSGGNGDDQLDGGAGTDTLNGGAGTDTAIYATAGAAVTVSLAISAAQNTLGAGSDTLIGMENLTGSTFNDVLTGSSLANRLSGGDGADRLTGLAGADVLIGGAGDDTFAFFALSDSTAAASDTLLDFDDIDGLAGDRIDLSAIDAIAGGRDNAFNFIGTAAFSNVAGQLRYDNTTPGTTLVQGDTNGDGIADIQFALQWTAIGQPMTLSNLDFVI
jgi:VCBS repeat-containing protein